MVFPHLVIVSLVVLVTMAEAHGQRHLADQSVGDKIKTFLEGSGKDEHKDLYMREVFGKYTARGVQDEIFKFKEDLHEAAAHVISSHFNFEISEKEIQKIMKNSQIKRIVNKSSNMFRKQFTEGVKTIQNIYAEEALDLVQQPQKGRAYNSVETIAMSQIDNMFDTVLDKQNQDTVEIYSQAMLDIYNVLEE